MKMGPTLVVVLWTDQETKRPVFFRIPAIVLTGSDAEI